MNVGYGVECECMYGVNGYDIGMVGVMIVVLLGRLCMGVDLSVGNNR